MDKEWYEIRDLLFGHNFQKQDIAKAIRLARHCAHPDAVLICNAIKQVEPSKEALIIALVEHGKHDVRALCFAWCLLDSNIARLDNMNWLDQASDAGFAFAQARKCRISYHDMSTNSYLKSLAEDAVSKNERDAYWCLVKLHENEDIGLKAAKEGATLGCVYCMTFIGRKSPNLTECITWLGKASLLSDNYYFKQLFDRLEIWNCIIQSPLLIYLVGYYAKLTLSLPRLEVGLFLRSNHAVEFYTAQNTACRSAVDTWSLCAMRLRLYKDVRVLIAKIVWDSRSEALFDIPQ